VVTILHVLTGMERSIASRTAGLTLVFGLVNAAMVDGRRGGENADKAIEYLERSIAGQGNEADPNVRATLPMRTRTFSAARGARLHTGA